VHTFVLITNCINEAGNAITSIYPFVCLSICFHSVFQTDWLLNLNVCVWVGHDHSLQEIEDQDYRARSESWIRLTQSVQPRSRAVFLVRSHLFIANSLSMDLSVCRQQWLIFYFITVNIADTISQWNLLKSRVQSCPGWKSSVFQIDFIWVDLIKTGIYTEARSWLLHFYLYTFVCLIKPTDVIEQWCQDSAAIC